ncbi:SRPBCC family protein [Streptomyces sp. NPDC013953]|uniref:SRPBCC family protein n=1 Tax=Streptomyces sp. NPDC013953 TaxID=3364868 RepID=UPI0036FCC4F0
MTGSGGTGLAGDAGSRLKEELQHYLEARAERAVSSMGERLGDATKKLGEGSPLGTTLGSLAKGGQALGQGASPGRALATTAMSQVKGSVKDKVSGLLGKIGKGGGKGETRAKSVVVIEDVDVGVPVREAYDQWTQFQEFGRFTKGVVNVEKSDETTSQWQVKVAKSNRSWKASVVEQIPDERIVWTSEGAKGTTKGAVTFHPLGDNLTKVLLVLEYFPKGLFEKTGNIWRAQGRRARLDLKLYRKYVTLRDEPAEGWRGEIRDGEVTRDHEEDQEDQEKRAEAGDERPEDEDEERPRTADRHAEEDEEDAEADWAGEDQEDEDDEDEDAPRDDRRREPYADDAYAEDEEPYEDEDRYEDEEDDERDGDDEAYDDEDDADAERSRRRAAARR